MWNPDTTSEEEIIFSTCSNALFKGGLTLVNSVAVLKQRGWNNFKLHLAGVDFDGEVGKRIVKVIKEQSLEKNIIMLGRLNAQQIIDEMLKARVFILPSHMDNSPNSLCEALLMGMPCIASHVGGIPSLITQGVNGVLYHDRDPYMLAEKIIQILSDRQMAAQLGAQARQMALVRHDRKRIAERTVQIYQIVGQA
jgi:glycosyltransferase involved in cell wall biosynthesis